MANALGLLAVVDIKNGLRFICGVHFVMVGRVGI